MVPRTQVTFYSTNATTVSLISTQLLMLAVSTRSKEKQKQREEKEDKKKEEKPKSSAATHDEVRLSCRKLIAGALAGKNFDWRVGALQCDQKKSAKCL